MSTPDGNKVDRVCDAIRAKLEVAGHNKYVQHLVPFWWSFVLGTDLSRAGLVRDLTFNCCDLWFDSTLGAHVSLTCFFSTWLPETFLWLSPVIKNL